MVKHIKKKSISKKSLCSIENCIMLNISLTKTEQNTQGVQLSFLPNDAKMNKISEG